MQVSVGRVAGEGAARWQVGCTDRDVHGESVRDDARTAACMGKGREQARVEKGGWGGRWRCAPRISMRQVQARSSPRGKHEQELQVCARFAAP
eukprot:360089-Chlamydomonas_euryale.AAC.6